MNHIAHIGARRSGATMSNVRMALQLPRLSLAASTIRPTASLSLRRFSIAANPRAVPVCQPPRHPSTLLNRHVPLSFSTTPTNTATIDEVGKRGISYLVRQPRSNKPNPSSHVSLPPSSSASYPSRSSLLSSSQSLRASLLQIDVLHFSSTPSAPSEPPQQPTGKLGALRVLWKEYGWTVIGTYLSIYVGTLGMMYTAISSGLIGGGDVLHWVDALGMADHFPSNLSPASSNLLVAWVATKLTEPLRLAVTIAITPRVARWIGTAPKDKSTKDVFKQVAQLAKPQKKKDQ